MNMDALDAIRLAREPALTARYDLYREVPKPLLSVRNCAHRQYASFNLLPSTANVQSSDIFGIVLGMYGYE